MSIQNSISSQPCIQIGCIDRGCIGFGERLVDQVGELSEQLIVNSESLLTRDVQPGRCLTFTGAETITSAHLIGSETVVSSQGTSTPSVAAGVISFTAGTCNMLLLSDGSRYNLEETTGSVAIDSSGALNHGTLVGAPVRTIDNTLVFSSLNQEGYNTGNGSNGAAVGVLIPRDDSNHLFDSLGNPLPPSRQGSVFPVPPVANDGYALILDGVGECSFTNQKPASTASHTSSFWIKTTFAGSGSIYDARTAAATGLLVDIVVGVIKVNVNATTIATPLTYNDGVPHFVEVNWDGADADISVDGTQVVTSAAVGAIPITTSFAVGCQSFGLPAYFGGFQISMLNLEGVTYPFADGAGTTCYSDLIGTHCSILAGAGAGDIEGAGLWAGRSPNNYNLVVGHGQRMLFNSIDTVVTLTTPVTLSGPFDVSFGINRISSPATFTVLGFSGGNGRFTANTFSIGVQNSSGITRNLSFDTPLDSGLHRLCRITRDGADRLDFYVDGVLQGDWDILAGDIVLDLIGARGTGNNFAGHLYLINLDNQAAYPGIGTFLDGWEDIIGENDGVPSGVLASVRIPSSKLDTFVDGSGAPTLNPAHPTRHNASESSWNVYDLSLLGGPIPETANLTAFDDIVFADTRTDLVTNLQGYTVFRRCVSELNNKDHLLAYYDTVPAGPERVLALNFTNPLCIDAIAEGYFDGFGEIYTDDALDSYTT